MQLNTKLNQNNLQLLGIFNKTNIEEQSLQTCLSSIKDINFSRNLNCGRSNDGFYLQIINTDKAIINIIIYRENNGKYYPLSYINSCKNKEIWLDFAVFELPVLGTCGWLLQVGFYRTV